MGKTDTSVKIANSSHREKHKRIHDVFKPVDDLNNVEKCSSYLIINTLQPNQPIKAP